MYCSYTHSESVIKPPPQSAALLDDDVILVVCSFVCHQRIVVGQWPDWPRSTIVLAAVSGQRAAGPVVPLPETLMAAGAYRVGHSGSTDLLYLLV